MIICSSLGFPVCINISLGPPDCPNFLLTFVHMPNKSKLDSPCEYYSLYQSFTIDTLKAGLSDSQHAADPLHHAEMIEAMIAKYSSGLEYALPKVEHNGERHVAAETILLTGSTGNLGSEILASLLSMDRVRRVYALNRRSSSFTIMERHKVRFEDRALDVSLLSSPKLVFLEGENDLPDLGLSGSITKEVWTGMISRKYLVDDFAFSYSRS